MEAKNSYRQVLKATSLFGGVQVFNILISIIRSKFIALFIGPAGMGIAALLNSTLNLITGMTDLGLNRSAVKDISFAHNNSDPITTGRTVAIFKRLVWFTGVAGTVLMIIFSSWLSEIAFGNTAYTFSFICVSAALLLKQLTNSNLSVLQGLQQLKKLAKANLAGNLIALLITVPLYYFFRIDAIVPAIIIAALISFIVTVYYANNLSLKPTSLSNKEVFIEGKSMIHLGIMLSLSSMITLVVAYVVQIFISSRGGIAQVGLYNAGIVILNSYVGLVFVAMETDYFPRLSAVSDKIEQIRKLVYEQAYIAILLITPIIVLFLSLAPFIIPLLYTTEFTPITIMVCWGILGMLFKAVSWSMGFVVIAKGDSKLFIKTAIGFNAILLLGNLIGYHYGGLEGIGISFLLHYIIHWAALTGIVKSRYGFYFAKGFYPIFAIGILLCAATFLGIYIENDFLKYGLHLFLFVLAAIFSLNRLNKKMDIKESLNSLFKRKND